VNGETLRQLADLAVRTGANVQPGQIVAITAEPESIDLVRAVAESAYRRGARFVDPSYFDPQVKRLRVELADEDTLDFIPPWYGQRLLALGEHRAALISLAPLTPPGLLEGLDPARAGKDPLPFLKETFTVINDRSISWTVVPSPTPAWARAMYPDGEPVEALALLERAVAHVCRLEEPDPAAAWGTRLDALDAAARTMNEHRFDALHFEGPGTDLTVGLLPGSIWKAARMRTREGIEHVANLPTEEIATAPDPARADGVVRSTKPLEVGGALVTGLRVRFEGGRAVAIDADENADALRGRCAVDEGAARLGEVALVDRESRIGALDTVFMNTLLDENAASHVALGNAYAISVGDEDRHRINKSGIHVDFMIGSDEVAVTGVKAGGERVPVLRGGAWQTGSLAAAARPQQRATTTTQSSP
jgi:aminopeptidase